MDRLLTTVCGKDRSYSAIVYWRKFCFLQEVSVCIASTSKESSCARLDQGFLTLYKQASYLLIMSTTGSTRWMPETLLPACQNSVSPFSSRDD